MTCKQLSTWLYWRIFTLNSGFDTTIKSTENLANFFGSTNFERVRFVIENGSRITIEVNALLGGV